MRSHRFPTGSEFGISARPLISGAHQQETTSSLHSGAFLICFGLERKGDPYGQGTEPEVALGADLCQGAEGGRTLPLSCRSRARPRRSAPLIYPSSKVAEALREVAESPLKATNSRGFFVGSFASAPDSRGGRKALLVLGERAPTLAGTAIPRTEFFGNIREWPRHLSKVGGVLHGLDLS